MPSPIPAKVTASSGIQTTLSGERHIPQSVRADGSVRKEIKIRPGYRPPEDVEVYKNLTAETLKSRGGAGVPGAEGLGMNGDTTAGAKGKNAKRREARKKAKVAGDDEQREGTRDRLDQERKGEALDAEEQPPELGVDTKPPKSEQTTASDEKTQKRVVGQLDPKEEKEKQARNLKKKLRQARDLQSKKELGESLLPEQFAKVIRIQELIRQLDALGFDSDGARKPKDAR